MGTVLIVSSIDVYFRDLEHLLEVFLNLLFYMTPIIYPLSQTGRYKHMLMLNPMASLIESLAQPVRLQPAADASRSLALPGLGRCLGAGRQLRLRPSGERVRRCSLTEPPSRSKASPSAISCARNGRRTSRPPSSTCRRSCARQQPDGVLGAGRCLVLGEARREHGHHRAKRLREEHAPEDHGRPGASDPRHDRGQRARFRRCSSWAPAFIRRSRAARTPSSTPSSSA